MVSCLNLNAVLATPRERADLHRCFGIDRDAQDIARFISRLVDLSQVLEDGVGLGEFGCGRVLATFLGK